MIQRVSKNFFMVVNVDESVVLILLIVLMKFFAFFLWSGFGFGYSGIV